MIYLFSGFLSLSLAQSDELQGSYEGEISGNLNYEGTPVNFSGTVNINITKDGAVVMDVNYSGNVSIAGYGAAINTTGYFTGKTNSYGINVTGSLTEKTSVQGSADEDVMNGVKATAKSSIETEGTNRKITLTGKMYLTGGQYLNFSAKLTGDVSKNALAVELVRGTYQIYDIKKGEWVEGTKNISEIGIKDIIRTGEDTRIDLKFTDGSIFKIKSNTEATMIDGGLQLMFDTKKSGNKNLEGRRVDENGNVHITLQKQGKNMQIMTPISVCGPLGIINSNRKYGLSFTGSLLNSVNLFQTGDKTVISATEKAKNSSENVEFEVLLDREGSTTVNVFKNEVQIKAGGTGKILVVKAGETGRLTINGFDNIKKSDVKIEKDDDNKDKKSSDKSCYGILILVLVIFFVLVFIVILIVVIVLIVRKSNKPRM